MKFRDYNNRSASAVKVQSELNQLQSKLGYIPLPQ